MQDNTITLTGLTGGDEAYDRSVEETNSTIYYGPDHEVGMRQQLELKRNVPQAKGEYRGTSRTTAKFTEDVKVSNVSGDGELVSSIIVETVVSAPLGVTEEQVTAARERAAAFEASAAASALRSKKPAI